MIIRQGSERMRKQNAGVWAGMLLFACALVMFLESFSLRYMTNFGPGPGMFPRWLSGILMIISLAYIWYSVKKNVITVDEILPKGRDLTNVVSVVAALILFMVLLNVTGFPIAGTIMMFMLLVREFKWYTALGISVFTTVVLFILFRVFFRIPLPEGFFGL